MNKSNDDYTALESKTLSWSLDATMGRRKDKESTSKSKLKSINGKEPLLQREESAETFEGGDLKKQPSLKKQASITNEFMRQGSMNNQFKRQSSTVGDEFRRRSSVVGMMGIQSMSAVEDDSGDDTDDSTKQDEKAKLEADKKDPELRKKGKELLGKYVSKFKGLIFLGLCLNLIGMIEDLTFPLFIGWFLDTIVEGDFERVFTLMQYFMLITVAGGTFQALTSYIFTYTNHRFGQEMRHDLFKEIMSKDIQFFDSRKPGDLISRLNSDVAAIQDALSQNFASLIKSLILCFLVIAIVIMISWQMTVCFIVVMIPFCLIVPFYGANIARIKQEISDKMALQTETSQETFSNIRTIKAFASEDIQSLEFFTRNLNVFKNQQIQSNWEGCFFGFITIFIWGSITGLIYFASYLAQPGVNQLTVGNFNQYMFYMFTFVMNFSNVGAMMASVMGAVGNSAVIAKIYAYEPSIEIKGGEDVTPTSIEDGRIQLSNIKFSYPTKMDIKVLKGISITVEKNKTVALVGSSGCGKSTIIQLVERFYDPLEGSVNYGQQKLPDLEPRSYKKHLAIVQQEPILFSGTIRENVLYGLDEGEVTEEDMIEACRHANVMTFLEDKNIFPKGFETEVGERGVKLSGGQKQRIAIARALVRKPKVLLLDEATSALDADSEHQVQQALDHVVTNSGLSQTIIVIAHRLSTIQNADEIIVLKEGVISERGTHHELLKNENGVYKKLVERQLAGLTDQ